MSKLSNEKCEFIKKVSDVISSLLPCSDFKVCQFIGCQAALESNFGKSRIAIENHNLFGMKLALSRPTTAVSERFEHALYETTYDSCVDYLYWLCYRRPLRTQIESVDDFAKFIHVSHYCPSPRYVSSILSLYEQYIES